MAETIRCNACGLNHTPRERSVCPRCGANPYSPAPPPRASERVEFYVTTAVMIVLGFGIVFLVIAFAPSLMDPDTSPLSSNLFLKIFAGAGTAIAAALLGWLRARRRR